MTQYTTIYRLDYTEPITGRYKFKDSSKKFKESHKGLPNHVCECHKQSQTKEYSEATVPEAKKTNLKMEWTGIAPMGRLVEPRIIPPDSDGHLGRSHRTTSNKCFEDQPNKFLNVLKKCYPNLYERLKQMSDNELNNRLNDERFKTTYQIDYCRIPEFPVGIYQEKNIKEEENEINESNPITADDCDEQLKKEIQATLDAEQEENQKSYNPRYKKNDLQPFVDNTSHWSVGTEFTNKPRITEYLDKIGRTGCIVMKNNIHDHKNCGDGHKCVHELKNMCKKFQ